MKKMIAVLTAVVLVIILAVSVFPAGANQPSSKATASVEILECIAKAAKETDTPWIPILGNSIKTASQKDLFIDAALQCGLYTKTKVEKGKGSGSSTATAQATVEVRIIRDQARDWQGDDSAYIAAPGPVVYCDRIQTLEWVYSDSPNEEELMLILETLSANAFNFIFADLESGTHAVIVQARIDSLELDPLLAEAWAWIGKGSVTIEEVRMIQNEIIEF